MNYEENDLKECFDFYRLYDCYKALVKLGFDFEKNTAKDFIDCILYIYDLNNDSNL